MKVLVTILAAAVLSGLTTYLLFDLCNAFGVMSSNVVCNITTFVLFIAALTTSSAALGLLMRRVIDRADRRTLAQLEDRIRMLEQTRSPTAPPLP